MEQFDKVMRDLSLKMARTTTRRGFLSRTVQASVGMGLLVGVLFGYGKRSFASGCLSFPAAPYDPNHPDDPNVQWCANPDMHADDCNYGGEGNIQYVTCMCADSDGPCENCPTDYTLDYTYRCCCDGRAKRCTKCKKTNSDGTVSFCKFAQLGASCP